MALQDREWQPPSANPSPAALPPQRERPPAPIGASGRRVVACRVDYLRNVTTRVCLSCGVTSRT